MRAVHAFLVFEDFRTAPRRLLARVFGVDWTTTPLGWLVAPAFMPLGLLAGLVAWNGPFAERLGIGLLAGIVVLAAQVLHELGHVISARIAGGPMREVLFTAVRPLTLYDDTADLPRRVHVGRAIGGPAINLALGLAALPLSRAAGPEALTFLLGFFAWLNTAFGLISLLPIPSVDGEVIWRR